MFSLRVRCPKCGKERSVTTTLRVKCLNDACNKTFEVFPKGGHSRVIGLKDGTNQDLTNLYYKQRHGK